MWKRFIKIQKRRPDPFASAAADIHNFGITYPIGYKLSLPAKYLPPDHGIPGANYSTI